MTNAPTDIEQIEEWILSQAGDQAADAAEMRRTLQRLADELEPARADACAELWQEELLNREQADELIDLLKLRAGWHRRPEFKATCLNVLTTFFNTDVFHRTLLQHAGFDQRELAPDEPLQRLQRLRAMR
ncbi:MAG: hypothetical protein LC725_08585, partial [Lentisphaerae bacterium]|nr:hypothetical protein [Lentisphaerota bacterium]